LSPALFIALWLIANVLIVGLYDVFALFFLSPEETVSYWMQAWLRAFPVLGIALGIVIGHLAWPIRLVVKGANPNGQ